jgi:hypothetical protein
MKQGLPEDYSNRASVGGTNSDMPLFLASIINLHNQPTTQTKPGM